MKVLKFFLFVLFLSHNIFLYAVVAYPGKIAVCSEYGETMLITLHGDENCKYGMTSDGYTLLQRDSVWYYAVEDAYGNVVSSTTRLFDHSCMTTEQREFVYGLKKGLVPSRQNGTDKISLPITEDLSSTNSVIGDRRILVILMSFADLQFVKTYSDFDRLFNEPEYNEDGAKGSVHDYYKIVSYGKLNLQADIIGPFKASHNLAYYGGNSGDGGNDSNPYQLFLEAIEYAKSEVNLKDYDADGDGYIDNVHIIFAGYGEESGASSNSIWSHRASFRAISVGGVLINGYSCSPELRGKSGSGISRIGPPCHEIGHALGAKDYYDTNYQEEGQYDGTGSWDVMGSGSWNNGGISPAPFNPYVKIYDFGWTTPVELKEDQEVCIGGALTENEIYKIDTGISGDFYLLENHNGEYFMQDEPGEGLLVFHIGPYLPTKSTSNKINSTYPQQCYIVCASSQYRVPTFTPSTYGTINSDGCPFPGSSGNSEFSNSSVPAAVSFDGTNFDFSLSNIIYESGSVSFYFSGTNIIVPGEPDKPQDSDVLWYEDFEYGTFLRTWKVDNETEDCIAEVVSVMTTSDTSEHPAPSNGKGYFSLKSTAMTLGGASRSFYSLCSEDIELNEGETYVLSFMVRKYSRNDEAKNSVSISDSNDNVTQFEVIPDSKWDKLSYTIDKVKTPFSFTMKCDVSEGASLFIDDIRISKKDPMGINNNSYKSFNNTSYDLLGRILRKNHSGIIIKNGVKILSR